MCGFQTREAAACRVAVFIWISTIVLGCTAANNQIATISAAADQESFELEPETILEDVEAVLQKTNRDDEFPLLGRMTVFEINSVSVSDFMVFIDGCARFSADPSENFKAFVIGYYQSGELNLDHFEISHESIHGPAEYCD